MVFPLPNLALPWAGLRREDRRFRRILVSTLLTYCVLGAILGTFSLPSREGLSHPHLTPRIAYLIDQRPSPPASASSTQQPVHRSSRQTEDPRATANATLTPSQPVAKETPAPPPGQPIAREGVLAFSEALQDLRKAAPRIAPASPVQGSGHAALETDLSGHILMNTLAQGSGGIDLEPSNSSEALGWSSLLGSGINGGRQLGNGNASGSSGSSPGYARAQRQRKISRSQEEIQEILDRNKSRMYALYNRELKRHPALQGKVVVSLTIAPSGAVTRCFIVYSELRASTLEGQLINLIKSIDFGDKPGAPVVTTQVPIEFFPA
ncbi:MAG: AgmX/PglI C-terminal domain-containing protein [Gammaproteobacteria bacterium]